MAFSKQINENGILRYESKLNTFIIPPNLKTLNIGICAFAGSELSKFIIPNSVNILKIGYGAFFECKKLEQFILPSNNPEFKNLLIGNLAFAGSKLSSFTVPDSVRELKIGRRSFKKSNIKQFVVPENVENLELFPDSFETGCTVKIPSKFLGKLNFTEANYTVQYV